jgi:esterase
MHLHFTEVGSGEPLLALHGLLGSHQNLLPVCRPLVGVRRIFAIDQRNHGHSPHSEEMHYQALADDIVRFMDQHGLQEADVLGHSMGGKTAMQLALNHPTRVRKLVVADIAPRAYGPRFASLLQCLRDLHPERFQTRLEADSVLATTVPEQSLRQFLLKNLVHDPAGGGYRWRININTIADCYNSLREAVDGVTPFTGAVLFLIAGKSDYVRDEDRWEILRLFPRAQFKTIPDAGHWLHAEKPEEFTAAVLQFLDQRNVEGSP